MSALKNLYFDLVPFAYHAAFYEGLKEELKKIDCGSSVSYPKNYSFSCKKMLDNSYNIML